jgi:hypothetical protein
VEFPGGLSSLLVEYTSLLKLAVVQKVVVYWEMMVSSQAFGRW